jgi:hypothetical protein
LDSLGNLKWQRPCGGNLSEYAYDVREDADGGYIVAGSSMSTDGDVTENKGSRDIWVFKLDKAGNFLWEKSVGGTGTEEARSVALSGKGDIVVAGYSNSSDGDIPVNKGDVDLVVAKFQCLLPAKPFISVNAGVLSSSSATGNQWYRNGVLLSGETGQTYTPSSSAGSYTVVVTNGCGSASSDAFIIVGISSVKSHSGELTLHPNPFSESTVINYQLAENVKKAALKIYDVQGRMVKALNLDPEESSVRVYADEMKNGVYFCSLETDRGASLKKRMVIIR